MFEEDTFEELDKFKLKCNDIAKMIFLKVKECEK